MYSIKLYFKMGGYHIKRLLEYESNFLLQISHFLFLIIKLCISSDNSLRFCNNIVISFNGNYKLFSKTFVNLILEQ